MSLQLDARQRAMLEEIGIKLFWPEPQAPEAEEDAPAAVREAPAVRAEAPTAQREPAPVRREPAPAARASAVEAVPVALPADLAALDWDALQQAVADWARGLRRVPVFGAGDRQPDWLCVGDPPVEEEERQRQPFVGEPGKLLDNMLAAVGASRERGAYLTNALKCRPGEDRTGEAAELAQSAAFLRRQVELLQPRVVLAMGRFAVQALLQTTEPLGKLRGRVHRAGEVSVVVTYHPAYLLRNLADKGKAWADLCLAQSVVRGQG